VPTVTFDGRSFMIDGRRIWLVSGSVHYVRIPRQQWEERIWAARAAGLNCIETPVFWNRHEPRPGQFDFTGDTDLRHFVELIGRAGLYCILRPGPFIGSEWDMGGLPPWLMAVKNLKLRAPNQPFLESCSRYITAVAEQVRDLQVTSPGPGGGGPIILVQNEMSYTGGDDKEADTYLGEIARYLRESGFNIPVLNSNNLWQGIEGEIDCWSGGGDLLGTLRQLATVRPDQPRVVIDFEVGSPALWGVPGSGAPEHPGVLQQRMAQVLAAGGQLNLSPFNGGTNFGFWGGRLPETHHLYAAATRDHGAPLSETGAAGISYSAVRRLCTFASRFGRIFANLDPGYRPVVLAPTTEGTGTGDASARGAITLVHCSGPQGGVAFIFSPPSTRSSEEQTNGDHRPYRLILADGTALPVHIGPDGLAWCVFDAYLGGRARLDYCGMSAFAMAGKSLVVFGPAGTEGVLSINGSPLHVHTPKGRAAPTIVEHEGITVVVCNQEQTDTVFIAEDTVYVAAAGLNRQGEPIGLPGAKQCVRINPDGTHKNVPVVHGPGAVPPPAAPGHKGEKIPISDWMVAGTTDYCDGSSARFASIDGPADLSTLGSPYGYGWYRLRLKMPSAGKFRIAIPQGADRLHPFLDGEPAGVLGYGPGAAPDVAITGRKGQATLVILAENLGRLCGGAEIGEPKGVYGDVWQVDAIKPGKPAFKTSEPIDALTLRTPVFEIQPGELTHPERITWTIQHRRKSPVIVTIGAFPGRALLIANDKPIVVIHRGGGVRHILQGEQLRTGTNTIQLALIPDRGGEQEELDGLLATVSAPGAVTFCEALHSLSAGAEWAFAKWETPRPTAYQKFKPGPTRGCPAWWRAHFRAPAGGHGLLFEAAGLTKGQLYVNERHISRYFVATADGKHVPPQQFYYIPGPWLRPDEENELLVFDEHGGNPGKCRLLQENGRGA
jgi:hypothetical protein